MKKVGISMMKKLSHLEGMRALMAFNVIICHFVCVYYPEMYFSGYDSPLSCFVTTPLSALVNGNIAVVFFFALTGFLVGMSVFSKENITPGIVAQKAQNRYTRLLPVVFLATLVTFLMMKLNLQSHLSITNERVNVEFLAGYCNFEASIPSLFSNSFIWSFVEKNRYIGPFWTIKYEFWGYILTLLTAVSLKDVKWRRAAYLLISVAMTMYLDFYYVIFIMGLFTADLRFNQRPTFADRWYRKLLDNKIVNAACLVIASYFACCPMDNASPLYSFWYTIPGLSTFGLVNNILLRGFGMALFLFVSMKLGWIQKILNIKPLVFLGELSFETYALHWPIMLSLEAWLFRVLEKHMSYDTAALLSFAVTIPVIYVSSILLNRFVKKSKSYLGVLRQRYLAKKSD